MDVNEPAMTARCGDPHEAAETRLYEAARCLRLGNLLLVIPLRVNPALDTAAWCYNSESGRVEIHVNPHLALELPMRCLRAVLMHELMHHVGFNQHIHRFPPAADEQLVNLALDIALERVLSQTSFASAVDELRRRLVVDRLPAEPPVLSVVEALPLLACRCAPRARLPEEIGSLWWQYWDNVESHLSPVTIYSQLRRVMPPADSPDALGTPGKVGAGVTDDGIWVRRVPSTGEGVGGAIGDFDGEADQEIADAIRGAVAGQLGQGSSETAIASYMGPPAAPPSDEAVRRASRLIQTARDRRLVAARWSPRCLDHLFGGKMRSRVARLAYLVRPTRAELVRRVIGWPGVTYANRVPAERSVVAIYVDVSASMADVLAEVMALLVSLKRWLPSRLHVFDTEVRTVDSLDVFRGQWWRGCGTSFDAVFQHALESGYRDAVVVTDGISQVSREFLSQCRHRNLRMNAILFPDAVREPTTDCWHRWVEIK